MRTFLPLLAVAFSGAAFATGLVGAPEIARHGTEATIRWQTDVACGTRVKIAPHATVIEPSDHTPTTAHSARIIALQPGVAYQISLGTARKWLATQTLAAANTPTTPPPPLATATPQPSVAVIASSVIRPPARRTWGNPGSLPDHFNRHGGDFGATDPEDYARKAWEFQQQAKREGFPAKLDSDGTLRVFDPKTGAFAAYNRDGTTKTFFKPGSRDYFERQPGRSIDLKTGR
ncbi:MAG: hypothetical protein M3R59_09600 [Verrucomicrobiota bacterium]|nr:hypothetical protein [Verrucomicrobiota bacterium]